MTHVNFLLHRLLVSETQTDIQTYRQDKFVIDIYIYIYIYIYILEYRSLCSRILALCWRCGSSSRTARMSDAADLLTIKQSEWSDQVQNFNKKVLKSNLKPMTNFLVTS